MREHGGSVLGPEDFNRYRLMNDLAPRVGEMLEQIADTFLPRDFEELKEFGLGGGKLSEPSP